jgi:hypothetical protein
MKLLKASVSKPRMNIHWAVLTGIDTSVSRFGAVEDRKLKQDKSLCAYNVTLWCVLRSRCY